MNTTIKSIIAAFAAIMAATSMYAQGNTVRGKVLDENNEPLAGATISILNTDRGAVADNDGNFEIEVAPAETLAVYFLGYVTKEVVTHGRDNIVVSLVPEENYLEETVVIGYGTQKKINVTGAVSMVNYADEVESRPVTTTASILQGMNAGLMVTQGSGKPGGESMTIRVRGVGTLNGGTDPLVIVDGFEGSLESVSPDDIESVSVLKDAAACAIYGNRGANGVILVTTKTGTKGSKDSHTISYSGMVAITQPASHFNVVSNYADHMSMMNEAAENIDATKPYSDAMIDLWREKSKDPNGISESGYPNYMAYPNTDWLNDGLYRPGIYQKHTLSANGRSGIVSYLISANYTNNPGIIENTAMQKYQVRANVSVQARKWLELGVKLYGYESDRDLCDIDGASNYMTRRITPGFYPRYDGKYGWNENPEQDSRSGNALYYINRYQGYDKTRYQNATAFVNFTFPFDIKWSNSFNYAHTQNERKYHVNLEDGYSFRTGEKAYEYKSLANSKGYESVVNTYRWVFQSQLNWQRTFASKHEVSALLGYEMQYYHYNNMSGSKKNYTDFTLHQLDNATEIVSLGGTENDNAAMSFFGRVTYAYDSKYLFEANLRYDGSSRFGSKNRWGLFPSVSAGWRISEEGFMEDSGVDNLKLRASWGMLGNNGIGNYDHISTYASDGIAYPLGPNDALQTGLVSTLSNDMLGWETTTSYNIGVDFGIFDNRLTFEADLYDRITDGILYRAPVYATIGSKSAPYQNLCQVTNKGFELSLGWKDSYKDFTYEISGNFSRNWNAVTKYNGALKAGWVTDENGHRHYSTNIGDVSTGTTQRVMEGKIINEYYLLETYEGNGSHFFADGSVNPAGGPKDGMIRTEEDMQWLRAMVDAGNKFLPNEQISKTGIWYGDYIYADINGDGIYGDENDYSFQNISLTPKFYYGFQIYLGWKGIDLSMNFVGAGGGATYWFLGGANAYGMRADLSIPEHIGYDHYFYNPENPDDPRTNLKSKHGRLTMNLGAEQTRSTSTLWLYKTDYLRLKNLTIGYSLPSKILSRLKMKDIRIFFSGENLFTITDYPGMDPEITGNMNFYANLRQYSFGLNFKF